MSGTQEQTGRVERVSVAVGWVFAITLVLGYFFAISPRPLSAFWIVKQLEYKNVKSSHLLAHSIHVSDGVELENAMLLVEFKTNSWHLVRAHRKNKGRLSHNTWKHYLVWDTSFIGFKEFHHRPSETEVETFLVEQGWFFESDHHGEEFLEGKVFTNTWERALGYTPIHPWHRPAKVYSQDNLRIIEIMEEFIRSEVPERQEHLLTELTSLKKPPSNRHERVPQLRFYALTKGNALMSASRIKDLETISEIVVVDESGEPPLFEATVMQIRSLAVLQKIQKYQKQQDVDLY